MHFKQNYHRELGKPKMIASRADLDGGAYQDGTSMFEMKYFMTEKQKQEHDQERALEMELMNREASISSQGARDERIKNLR